MRLSCKKEGKREKKYDGPPLLLQMLEFSPLVPFAVISYIRVFFF